MSEETKHSLLPWRADVFESTTGEPRILIISSTNVVSQIDSGNDGTDWADARFACLAVNYHERLVEALEEALPLLYATADLVGAETAQKARALLAEIEGEQPTRK